MKPVISGPYRLVNTFALRLVAMKPKMIGEIVCEMLENRLKEEIALLVFSELTLF